MKSLFYLLPIIGFFDWILYYFSKNNATLKDYLVTQFLFIYNTIFIFLILTLA